MKPLSWVLLTGLFALTGCTQSLLNHTAMESRVIEQFADALDEENESALRHATSTRFEELAFQSEDVLRDLRVMHLPTGELSVVDVKDTGKGRREVIVKEEDGGKYQFHLINDPVKKHWVVDDVVVRKRTKGTQVTKSTIEVIQLLATLRSFLDVWETGAREEIFAVTSPDLKQSLEPLPDAWLRTLTGRIAATYEEGMARKPQANLHSEEAVVKLPARNGHLLIKIVRADNGWLVDDIEAHSHRDENHAGSIKRQADAITTVNGFLTAFAGEDHQTLQAIAEPRFYKDALKFADLSMLQLPLPRDIPAEYDLRAYENRLTFMLPADDQIVRLDLAEQETPPSGNDGLSSRFLVHDVTIYDRSTQKQQSLSAVFTAPTRAALFLKALAGHNHQILSQMSTTALSHGTWDRLTPEMLQALPIPPFSDEGLKLTDSHSVADTTELEFESSNGIALSCRLVSRNGILKVDDIQYPNALGQVTSLKSQLQLAAPLIEFAQAWEAGDMESLQKACSTDFNRLVWTHLEQVPTRYGALASRLLSADRDTRITQERATVIFKDGADNLSASLVQEHDYWVVDDVRLETSPGVMTTVRGQLRGEIAERILNGSYSTVMSEDGYEMIKPVKTAAVSGPQSESGIQQVSAEMSHRYNKGAIVHPLYKELIDPQTGRTNSRRVTPAVRTRVLPPEADALAFDPDQMSEANEASAGVMMFGPNGSQSGQQPSKVSTLSLNQPIDMTPEDGPHASGRMPMAASGEPETVSKMQGFSTGVKKASAIRQPADAPISIQ